MSENTKVKLTALKRYGKNFQIIFSIRSMKFHEEIFMDPINIRDMCLLRFQFVYYYNVDDEYNKLLSKISFKKHENARKTSTAIKISHADFEQELLVGEDWNQLLTMGSGIVLNKKNCFIFMKNGTDFFVNIEVNIKVYHITANPLLVNQRLYKDAIFTDFNLKAEDGVVAVHKAVLSTQSDVFLAMFHQEWNETIEGTFSINGGSVTMQTLLAFKDYMYLQTLSNDLNELQKLLQIASCYMIDNLKTDCITKLVELVTPENFDGVVEFACLNNLPDLIKAIVTGIPEKVFKGIQEKNDDKKVSTDNTS